MADYGLGLKVLKKWCHLSNYPLLFSAYHGNLKINLIKIQQQFKKKWYLKLKKCILKTDYFQLWFLYKSNLRISTVGKHTGIIII